MDKVWGCGEFFPFLVLFFPFLNLFSICFVFSFLIFFCLFLLKKKVSAFNKTC